MSSGGPIQIGHDRNVAARKIEITHAMVIVGCSSHAVSAHHIATANSVETVCERNPSCVKAPKKYGAGRKSSALAQIANGTGNDRRRAIRNTNPAVSAAHTATSGK